MRRLAVARSLIPTEERGACEWLVVLLCEIGDTVTRCVRRRSRSSEFVYEGMRSGAAVLSGSDLRRKNHLRQVADLRQRGMWSYREAGRSHNC